MLIDFFKLNGEVQTLITQESFLNHFKTSNDIRNVLYQPPELVPDGTPVRFTSKTFENVSFSKTHIRDVSFSRCSFIDCLFIGTEFEDCEFHRCTFIGCNTFKAKFVNTYINPTSFDKNALSRDKHANIGVGLFHELYSNAINTHQRDFIDSAEYRFRVWQRHQLKHEVSVAKGMDRFKLRIEWLLDLGYFVIAGYGLRPLFFMAWSVAAVALIVVLNFNLWEQLAIVGQDGAVKDPTGVEAFYYSMVTVTTFGLGGLAPTSDFGMIIISLEAMLGLIWVGLLAAIIIKRLVR